MNREPEFPVALSCSKDRFCVKAVLAQKGISMKQLSHDAHVSYGAVRRICSGTCRNCRLTTLGKIAKVLEVPINTLLND
jgi:DNA-binding Xre family transcriptional regulator